VNGLVNRVNRSLKMLHGRALPLAAGLALLVTTAACTVESPASTPLATTPAILFQHQTVELAWRTAAQRKRPLVIMFKSDRCPHCDRMLAETYAHPQIRQYLYDNAETALAHSRDYADLVKRLGIRGYPTTLVISAEGQIVDSVEGFLEPAEFARRIARSIGPRTASAQLAPATTAR
jgi:thioredoxin-related protein